MPLYSYECACGALFEEFHSIKEDSSTTTCGKCEGLARKVFIDPPRVRGDYEAYQCPITGKEIRGRRAHAENLARHDCRVLETGEREATRARVAADEARLEREVAETVEREIDKMPSRKLETLAAELASGVDISVNRGVTND